MQDDLYLKEFGNTFETKDQRNKEEITNENIQNIFTPY